MSTIVGESLFYETARVLHERHPISYYQYRALISFIEMIVLHDQVILFAGEETDDQFVSYFRPLIELVEENSDFHIDIVSSETRANYLRAEEIRQFEIICKDIYHNSLGIVSDDLFLKQPKDRTAEDMAERIETIFSGDYPDIESRKVAEQLYLVWLHNANSSELLYFFRAHLLQAIAEVQGLTPLYENQRMLASILQKKLHKNNRIGTLPFTIYSMVNARFLEMSDSLSTDKSYPRIPLFLNALVANAGSREEIIHGIFNLRLEFREFRLQYKRIEQVMTNTEASLHDKSELKERLQESLEAVWLPTISSLGRSYTSNALKRLGQGVFERYGIGDLKVAHSEKKTSEEDSMTYSTPSLFGLGTAILQTISEVRKISRLSEPNQALLDTLYRTVRLTEIRSKLSKFLPVRDFTYRIHRLIDSNLSNEFVEATK